MQKRVLEYAKEKEVKRSVVIAAVWFFAANQYINSQPIGSLQAGPFVNLQACEIQRDRYQSGLMTNNDTALNDLPGPCYSSNGFVKIPDTNYLLSPTGKQVPDSANP